MAIARGEKEGGGRRGDKMTGARLNLFAQRNREKKKKRGGTRKKKRRKKKKRKKRRGEGLTQRSDQSGVRNFLILKWGGGDRKIDEEKNPNLLDDLVPQEGEKKGEENSILQSVPCVSVLFLLLHFSNADQEEGGEKGERGKGKLSILTTDVRLFGVCIAFLNRM